MGSPCLGDSTMSQKFLFIIYLMFVSVGTLQPCSSISSHEGQCGGQNPITHVASRLTVSVLRVSISISQRVLSQQLFGLKRVSNSPYPHDFTNLHAVTLTKN